MWFVCKRCGVYLNAGREVAVASTKVLKKAKQNSLFADCVVCTKQAFTSQATVLTEIAVWFAQNRGEHGLRCCCLLLFVVLFDLLACRCGAVCPRSVRVGFAVAVAADASVHHTHTRCLQSETKREE